jgi:hypothetical protein
MSTKKVVEGLAAVFRSQLHQYIEAALAAVGAAAVATATVSATAIAATAAAASAAMATAASVERHPASLLEFWVASELPLLP